MSPAGNHTVVAPPRQPLNLPPTELKSFRSRRHDLLNSNPTLLFTHEASIRYKKNEDESSQWENEGKEGERCEGCVERCKESSSEV
ncbi:hypothetical protein COLO4_04821 [Corchorus olitorius]|uniref:Uncharacterized protein n=1 Tax=Corchorus olitorius TaxID=93759 RepID=A0A1R3KSP1_9ROSI|nr:hypothetical protein COLO4_04821 [Corchorus olitorius]